MLYLKVIALNILPNHSFEFQYRVFYASPMAFIGYSIPRDVFTIICIEIQYRELINYSYEYLLNKILYHTQIISEIYMFIYLANNINRIV